MSKTAGRLSETGSSPRGWGKARAGGGGRARGGIIPTRVGKGRTWALVTPQPQDHPHAGGERSVRPRRGTRLSGSSPRGWGKDLPGVRRVERPGIIPTRVGKGRWPRASLDVPRIIPTRVGKGARAPSRRSGSRDHPHAGGERSARAGAEVSEGGSSPRGWGKAAPFRSRRRRLRIIPTRVGKGDCRPGSRRLDRDHPHAGGERKQSGWAPRGVLGSSPRGWGKVQEQVVGGGGFRIIPMSMAIGNVRIVSAENVRVAGGDGPQVVVAIGVWCGGSDGSSSQRSRW